MLRMEMFVNFHVLYTCIFAHCMFLSLSSIVKHFEFLKVLYKFPVIIINALSFLFHDSFWYYRVTSVWTETGGW